jgi:hypothetical protein
MSFLRRLRGFAFAILRDGALVEGTHLPLRSTTMIESASQPVEAEPPSTTAPDAAACEMLLERAIAISHTTGCAHAIVVGHRTLPYMLALLHQGCANARSVRPGCPAPDCEAVELAWVVDLESRMELAEALRVARSRVGRKGRVVLEGAAFGWHRGVAN